MPDLGLNHDKNATNRRKRLEKVDQHRDRHVVRQVRDNRSRRSGQFGDGECIRLDDRQHAGRDTVLLGRRGQFGSQPRVNFDCGDGVSLLE